MRRGAPSRGRGRTAPVPGAIAVLLAVTLALAGCSSGKKHPATAAPKTTTVPKVLAIRTSLLKVGKVVVESAGPPSAQIDTATGKAVLAASQAYIDRAV